MKTNLPLLFSVLLLGLGLALAGCVGYVDDGGPYYHGWYHDGPWFDGPHGYIGVGVHPGYRRW